LRKIELTAVKQATERWFSTPRRRLRSHALERDPGAVPPYTAVRARRDGPVTGGPCAVPRLAPSQAVRAPRRLELRATRHAFLSIGPTPYCPCFARSVASPLHARRPRRVAVLGSNTGRLLRRTVEGPAGYKGRLLLMRRPTGRRRRRSH
jgi:hypothetical protein